MYVCTRYTVYIQYTRYTIWMIGAEKEKKMRFPVGYQLEIYRSTYFLPHFVYILNIFTQNFEKLRSPWPWPGLAWPGRPSSILTTGALK